MDLSSRSLRKVDGVVEAFIHSAINYYKRTGNGGTGVATERNRAGSDQQKAVEAKGSKVSSAEQCREFPSVTT